MTKLRMLLAIAAITVAGCATTKDYGAGKCTQYEPLCITGDQQCITDARGCRVCTCNSTESPDSPYGSGPRSNDPFRPN